jgi:hypothetical protein
MRRFVHGCGGGLAAGAIVIAGTLPLPYPDRADTDERCGKHRIERLSGGSLRACARLTGRDATFQTR